MKGGFYSGSGSYREDIVNEYTSYIIHFMKEKNIGTVIDLGCGDFNIGSKFAAEAARYIGVDIVEKLIVRNEREYGNRYVEFKCMDIVRDDLPDGDLCLVRQVLQHCTNKEIKIIMEKCKKYKYVLVTEHVWKKENSSKYNKNIKANRITRRAQHSGVYLEEKPFSLRTDIVRKWNYNENEEIVVYFIHYT